MQPFWRYYGGKWATSPHYPRPRHGLIVEPFAGAAGYSTRFGAGCDVMRATWFIDPPYRNHAGSYYPCQPADFDALGAWCRERRGLVIACENDGADWLPFRPLVGRRAVATARTGRATVEAVWMRDDAGPLTLFD